MIQCKAPDAVWRSISELNCAEYKSEGRPSATISFQQHVFFLSIYQTYTFLGIPRAVLWIISWHGQDSFRPKKFASKNKLRARIAFFKREESLGFLTTTLPPDQQRHHRVSFRYEHYVPRVPRREGMGELDDATNRRLT